MLRSVLRRLPHGSASLHRQQRFEEAGRHTEVGPRTFSRTVPNQDVFISVAAVSHAGENVDV